MSRIASSPLAITQRRAGNAVRTCSCFRFWRAHPSYSGANPFIGTLDP